MVCNIVELSQFLSFLTSPVFWKIILLMIGSTLLTIALFTMHSTDKRDLLRNQIFLLISTIIFVMYLPATEKTVLSSVDAFTLGSFALLILTQINARLIGTESANKVFWLSFSSVIMYFMAGVLSILDAVYGGSKIYWASIQNIFILCATFNLLFAAIGYVPTKFTPFKKENRKRVKYSKKSLTAVSDE